VASEAARVPAARPRAAVGQEKRRRDRRRQILLWIAVAVIMVFCLFPF
jgi:predicted nucleic acid-binding Zn ribbon protein